MSVRRLVRLPRSVANGIGLDAAELRQRADEAAGMIEIATHASLNNAIDTTFALERIAARILRDVRELRREASGRKAMLLRTRVAAG